MNRIKFLTLVTILISSLLIPQVAKADIGPKPQVNIIVVENGITRTDSLMKMEMLGCHKTTTGDCSWESSRLYWFQGCNSGTCRFTYFLPDSFKVAYQSYPGGRKIISDVVIRTKMNETYTLRINGGRATFSPSNTLFINPIFIFVLSTVSTIIIELLIVNFLVKVLNWPHNTFIALIVGNAISLPLVWLCSIFLNLYNYVWGVVVVEILAILIEWGFYYLFLKKTNVGVAKLFILALGQNLVSYLLGTVLIGLLNF